MYIKIKKKYFFLLNIILLQNKFILCESFKNSKTDRNSLEDVRLTDAQLQYLRGQTENEIVLLLLYRCQQQASEINLLLQTQNDNILKMIETLKTKKTNLLPHADAEEIKLINEKIKELYCKIN
jgi:hypothetical protein